MCDVDSRSATYATHAPGSGAEAQPSNTAAKKRKQWPRGGKTPYLIIISYRATRVSRHWSVILFYREPIAPTAVLSNNIKEGTSISSLLPQPMTMS